MGDTGIGEEPFDIVLLNGDEIPHSHGDCRQHHENILPRHPFDGLPDSAVQRLPHPKDRIEETDQERDRNLVATGFLAIGSKPAKAMNNNFAMDVVADQINVVSTAIMGLSVACARCHDHKHDPIPTRDYYCLLYTSDAADE